MVSVQTTALVLGMKTRRSLVCLLGFALIVGAVMLAWLASVSPVLNENGGALSPVAIGLAIMCIFGAAACVGDYGAASENAEEAKGGRLMRTVFLLCVLAGLFFTIVSLVLFGMSYPNGVCT